MLKGFLKNTVALALVVASTLSMFGCKKAKYEPVKSTDEENTVVGTLKINNQTYEVKYELYRAFFLNYKSKIDGGNSEVWTGEDSQKYIDEINELIIEKISYVYSALELARQCDINMYSQEVEEQIEEYIRISVEGDLSMGVAGYGTYDEYLEALKRDNLNYQAQVLLYRYSIAVDKLQSYFIGNLTEEGEDPDTTSGTLSYTIDDVRNFYYGEDCLRIMRAYINTDYFTEDEAIEKAERLRSKIISAVGEGDTAVALAIVQSSTSAMSDVEKGVIGKHNLNEMYYADLTKAAFGLEAQGVSEIIPISDNLGGGLYILYRADKSDEHFEKYYNYIVYTYLTELVGVKHSECAEKLKGNVSFTAEYANIVHANISMD